MLKSTATTLGVLSLLLLGACGQRARTALKDNTRASKIQYILDNVATLYDYDSDVFPVYSTYASEIDKALNIWYYRSKTYAAASDLNTDLSRNFSGQRVIDTLSDTSLGELYKAIDEAYKNYDI